MKLYHQTGHREKWNIESFLNDNAGDGIILSPVNYEYRKIQALSLDFKNNCFFDPQWYLPKDIKGKLNTYNFFPATMIENFQTLDFENHYKNLSKECIDFQIINNFQSIIIPMRYYDILPENYYEQNYEYIIEPFIEYFNSLNINKDIFITLIVKKEQLLNDSVREELLNWITGISDISGIYIIFENNFLSKQIKDTNYLFNVLKFIHILKSNYLKVIVGYTNTEAYLYSIANPDAVTMGSYENLRSFNINRFDSTKTGPPKGPNARIYSGKLLQWIDYGYLAGIQTLYQDWESLFENSIYYPLMFTPDYNWHFLKSEPYKHFFKIFSHQISSLPDEISLKINFLKNHIENAIIKYNELKECGIALDSDSDGSHLPFWLTVINMYERFLNNE